MARVLITGASSGFVAMTAEVPARSGDRTALDGLAALEPSDADPASVAHAIAGIIALPKGRRPFRTHLDPSEDGAEIVNGVADCVRAQLLERIGLADLLHPQI